MLNKNYEKINNEIVTGLKKLTWSSDAKRLKLKDFQYQYDTFLKQLNIETKNNQLKRKENKFDIRRKLRLKEEHNQKLRIRRSFSFLYKDKNISNKMTKSSKISLFFLSLLFLILFIVYEPFSSTPDTHPSLIRTLFNLYFFITNQTFFIIHEAGHGIASILQLPKIIIVFSGTILQLFLPILIAYYYEKERHFFASYLSIYFAGFSLQYTAWDIFISNKGIYTQSTQLFTDSKEYHDFNYILTYFDLVPYYHAISDGVQVLGYSIMFIALSKMYFSAFASQK